MASVTAKRSATKESKAYRDLQFALGEKRVALSELRPQELNNFLYLQLHSFNFTETSGFVELGQAISSKGNNGEPRAEVNEKTYFAHSGFSTAGKCPTLKSHVFRVCRGVNSQKLLYRNLETGETTAVWEKYRSWREYGYLYSGEEKVLLLRRTDPWAGFLEEALMEVNYQYEKVPNEKRYSIHRVIATAVPVLKFSEHFGKQAAKRANVLLWELASIYRQTAEAVECKAVSFRQEAVKREKVSESLTD